MENKDQKNEQKSPAITIADLEAREKQTEGQNLRIRSGVRAGAGRFAGPGRF